MTARMRILGGDVSRVGTWGVLALFKGRPSRGRVVAGVAAVFVTSLLLSMVTAGAAEAYTNPGGPPDSSGSWRFGVPLSEMPLYVGSTFTSCPTVSGWLNTNHMVTVGQPTSSTAYQPESVCADEPHFWPSHGIVFDGLAYWLKDNQAGALGSRFEQSAGAGAGVPAAVVRCQASQYALGSAGFDIVSGVNGGSGRQSTPSADGKNLFTGFGSITASTLSATTCPYVVYITNNIGVYTGGTTPTWSTWVWYADNARISAAVPAWNPTTDICKDPQGTTLNPVAADCPFLKGGVTDPTDPKQVCANPPTFTAPDLVTFFNNFFPTFSSWWLFWGKCMFVPAGGFGFDRQGVLASAWSHSAASTAASAVGGLYSAAQITESCGPLVNGSGKWSTMQLNTCNWSGFGAYSKPVLTVAITVLFGWWAVGFVVMCVTGIIQKKTPTPVPDWEDTRLF